MVDITPLMLKCIIVIFLLLEYFWEIYLSSRQLKKALNTKQVPKDLKHVMTDETFQKAREYTVAKTKFGMIKDSFSIALSVIVIQFDFLSIFWNISQETNPFNGEITTSCLWLLILSSMSTLLDLPFTIYYNFVIEEKFGFNKQTAAFFVWDKIKSFIISQIICLGIAAVVIKVVQNGGDYFFIWLWGMMGLITLLLLTIYPSLIAPLFDKYTPLPEGELRTDIENLATQLKFPLTQLYVVEGSKRSSHSNAYFYGLFNSKRIVLFDTLLAKDDGSGCQKDEILAVLSHELGHWKHNHVTKNILVFQVNLLLLFYVFAFMFKYPTLYKSFGFYNSQPVLVGLLGVLQYVMMPYNTFISFLMTCLSRKFEFQADEFAAKLGKSEPLQRALMQLNKDNLGFPVYDKLFSAWHHSHPPLLERFEALKHTKEE